VPVTYREVTVGKVVGFELGQTADRVLIHILIEPRYAGLVRGGSRFWNSSGFGFDWGLFKGATVRTESLETLIDGGIAFATPDGEQMGNPARPQQTFALFDKPEDAWLQWAPKRRSASDEGQGRNAALSPRQPFPQGCHARVACFAAEAAPRQYLPAWPM
jgi:paraquat-inducible protein B